MARQIRTASERIRILREKLKDLEAQESKRSRKLDTRQKIILGAELIALARMKDTGAVAMLDRLVKRIDGGRDQKLFSEFTITPRRKSDGQAQDDRAAPPSDGWSDGGTA